MRQIMRSSLDYAGFAQLCARSPIMRKIIRTHNRIIQRSLLYGMLFCLCSTCICVEAGRQWLPAVCWESWSGRCPTAMVECSVISHTSVICNADVSECRCQLAAWACYSGRHCTPVLLLCHCNCQLQIYIAHNCKASDVLGLLADWSLNSFQIMCECVRY